MEPINIKQFTWSKETKTLVAECSELKFYGMRAVIREGITVINSETGNTRKFTFSHTDENADDVHGWNFESQDGIKLLIIND